MAAKAKGKESEGEGKAGAEGEGSLAGRAVLGFPLEDELVDAVLDVGVALALNGRVAVALLGVLSERSRSVSESRSAQSPATQSTHLPPNQLGNDRVDVLDAEERDPDVALIERGQLKCREGRARKAHLVAETLGHLRTLILRTSRKADDASLDRWREGQACTRRFVSKALLRRSARTDR